MRALAGVVAAGLLCLAGLAQAAEPAPPIREFPRATIETLGAAIYRQDRAAWVATDALREKAPDLAGARLIGWIVVDDGAGQRVRFLRDVGQGPEAGYDIEVGPTFKTKVVEPADRTLTPQERAMFAARVSAANGLAGATVCRQGYNSVVLKDPEGDGWLAWMLAPMVEFGTIPLGIHYRFTISADGRTVTRRDALARGCGDFDTRKGAPKGTVAVGTTHLVSPEPVETQVFLQLQSGLPFYVMTETAAFAIEKGRIRDVPR